MRISAHAIIQENRRLTMLLIREVMYCKPGKVKAMVEKSLKMAKLNEELGFGKIRVMTDFCAERYWTIVSEFEVPSMHEFEKMMQGEGMTKDAGTTLSTYSQEEQHLNIVTLRIDDDDKCSLCLVE